MSPAPVQYIYSVLQTGEIGACTTHSAGAEMNFSGCRYFHVDYISLPADNLGTQPISVPIATPVLLKPAELKIKLK